MVFLFFLVPRLRRALDLELPARAFFGRRRFLAGRRGSFASTRISGPNTAIPSTQHSAAEGLFAVIQEAGAL